MKAAHFLRSCVNFTFANQWLKNVCKLVSDVDVLHYFLWIVLYLEWGEKEGERVISEGGKICLVVGF